MLSYQATRGLQSQITIRQWRLLVQSSDIQKIALLARLHITSEVAEQSAKSINEVLALVDQLRSVNTENIIPMSHPLDAMQVLREDEVTALNCRDEFQALAPETENGLYLVPKVID